MAREWGSGGDDAMALFLKECVGEVSRTLPSLNSAVHNREEDFLRLGASLQDFSSEAGVISDKAANLLNLTSEENLSRFILDLSQELDRMTDMFRAAASDENLHDLRSIIHTIQRLDTLIGDFGRIIRGLQMLSISTRIESARLGADGRGFSTLADDVEGLAHKIVAHSAGILSRTKALVGLVDKALVRTEAMRCSHDACSSTVIIELHGNLDALETLAARSRELSDHLAKSTTEVKASIYLIVSRLQFHDITRQQVEHVDHALGDVLALLRDVNRGRANSDATDVTGWVGDVISLQTSQLESAASRFLKAVDGMKRDLGAIAKTLGGLRDKVKEITRGDTASGGSALDVIEQSMGHVIKAMNEFADQGQLIGQDMVDVANMVAEIGAYLADIEDVGSEIELIALNASIKAAHTGDKGKALGVLASSVQGLSHEARLQTDATAEALRAISESADSLKQGAAEFLDRERVSGMVQDLGRLITELDQVNGRIVKFFAEIETHSAALFTSIERLNNSVSFHHDVAAELRRCRDTLVDISSRARALVPFSRDSRRPERLREMLKRYTMEAERIVHQMALLEQQPSSTAAEASGDAGEHDDELLGDVELF